jgi:hypothetical protein
MVDRASWSWEAGSRPICDLAKVREDFAAVHELVVSPDGEKVAAPVLSSPDTFHVCVNGETWDDEFEKAWHLVFLPDGRLTALVRIDDEWTVAVDGVPWDERWEFAWNTNFSHDGSVIAVQVKQDMQYTVAVDGVAWERRFHSSRGLAIADGRVAAVVQAVPLAEADTVGFMSGTWTVAVDGEPWERNFINVYSPVIRADGSKVAAQVRLDICEYTLAEDGRLWDGRFGGVWEPVYRPTGELLAPVRVAGSWTMAENGTPIWGGRYMQLWNQRLSPDGRRLAAVAAPGFGRWTVVVDDQPWKLECSDLVLPPVFSADGRRVAATVRHADRWTVAVDGAPWSESFDMVWDPVFSPSGDHVLAKVERDGRFAVAVDGRVWSPWYDALWPPVFNPGGDRLMLRVVEGGVYVRKIVPFPSDVRE